MQDRRLVALVLDYGLVVRRTDSTLLPRTAMKLLEWLPVRWITRSTYLLLGGALLAHGS